MPLEPIDVVRYPEFWRDGVNTAATNARKLLRMAGEPVTLENVAKIIESAPRDQAEMREERWREKSYCNRCLKAAFLTHGEKATDALMKYFLVWFPERMPVAQHMLIDALAGVASDEYESPSESPPVALTASGMPVEPPFKVNINTPPPKPPFWERLLATERSQLVVLVAALLIGFEIIEAARELIVFAVRMAVRMMR